MGTWRQLRAIALLPVVGTLVVPGVIVGQSGQVDVGWGLPTALAWAAPLLGAVLIGLGLLMVARTVALLARVGQGTLAPWDPTTRLVARGPYLHVRNPMISGVLSILLGQAALLGCPPLLLWAGAFFLTNAIYLPLVEERGLRRRFGEDYERYRANVPRWVPRASAWQQPPHRAV